MKPLNKQEKAKTRRVSAARPLLMLCSIMLLLLLMLQAWPCFSALLPHPPEIIGHEDTSYTSPPREKADTLLDINLSPAEDFRSLPGIGPVYSQAIVEYRENVSRFYFLEDLMNVKGIGPKRLEAIRKYLLDPWENAVPPLP